MIESDKMDDNDEGKKICKKLAKAKMKIRKLKREIDYLRRESTTLAYLRREYALEREGNELSLQERDTARKERDTARKERDEALLDKTDLLERNVSWKKCFKARKRGGPIGQFLHDVSLFYRDFYRSISVTDGFYAHDGQRPIPCSCFFSTTTKSFRKCIYCAALSPAWCAHVRAAAVLQGERK